MQVRLLGSMEVEGDDGTPVPVQGAKLRALLAMLALECGRVVSTDRLIDELWQDDRPAGVANALQQLVSKLRKVLGSSEIVSMRPPGYVLLMDVEDIDVHRVDRLVLAARATAARGDLNHAVSAFSEAEMLWLGPALADFVYDDFARPHIARLNEVRLSLIEERLDVELALGRHAQMVSDLEGLVNDNPVRERLRGQLMLALYRTGRQVDALRVFQNGRSVLADELGLDPGPELRQLEAAILNHDPSLRAPVAPTGSAGGETRSRNNLKAALTPLIGRELEVAELRSMLRNHRLVTVVGPGGAGKTRLATETARLSIDERRDGVFMVELAPVGHPDAVRDAIAAALDLPESDVAPMARVRQHCNGKDLLLVFDNCEHLVEAAARTAEEILGACEGVRILATSREALRVTGEAVWPVPPLDESDAGELFIQRATSADPAFGVGNTTRSVVGEICSRLDGLPLAIELAAARTRAFSVEQIAERLDDRFRLLSGGSRTAMGRQQTLRAVVDWSYDLLFEDERRVFERLSVFPGGCRIGTAIAVCADFDLDHGDVLELMAALVDKSLLFADRSGPEPRYQMLQTLSQYGRERLVERGEADAVYGRMAACFVELCARSQTAFRGVDQRQWFAAVDAEKDNIRAAFDWAVAAQEKEVAVAIAADLTFYRWVAGGVAEGFRWLDVALAMPGELTPFTEGRGLVWHAFLGYIAGRRVRVDEQFDKGIELLRGHADPVFVAYAQSFYSQVVGATGRLQTAAEINVAALSELYEAPYGPYVRAAQTWLRAALAIQQQGDFETFESLLRTALHEFRDAGDHFMTAVCLDLAAEFDELRGELDTATRELDEALDTIAGWRMSLFEAALTSRLAAVAVQTGDQDGAERFLQDALTRAEELSYRPARAQALNALANLRRRQGRLDQADSAASEALEFYRSGPSRRFFSSSFSRAPTPFDMAVGAAAALSVLGFVAEARGDAPTAISYHSDAYAEVHTTTHPRAVPLALEGLAAARVLGGNEVWAAQLLGCADRLRSGNRRSASEQFDVDRVQAAATARLGQSEFATVYHRGGRLKADDLVEAAAQS